MFEFWKINSFFFKFTSKIFDKIRVHSRINKQKKSVEKCWEEAEKRHSESK